MDCGVWPFAERLAVTISFFLDRNDIPSVPGGAPDVRRRGGTHFVRPVGDKPGSCLVCARDHRLRDGDDVRDRGLVVLGPGRRRSSGRQLGGMVPLHRSGGYDAFAGDSGDSGRDSADACIRTVHVTLAANAHRGRDYSGGGSTTAGLGRWSQPGSDRVDSTTELGKLRTRTVWNGQRNGGRPLRSSRGHRHHFRSTDCRRGCGGGLATVPDRSDAIFDDNLRDNRAADVCGHRILRTAISVLPLSDLHTAVPLPAHCRRG
jgi:hypothetical protein